MASIFYTCLQCGKHLKASQKTIASEVLTHNFEHKFDFVQFQTGIAMLQEEQKLKSTSQALPPLPPPPPPKLPSGLLYAANENSIILCRDNIG